MRRIAITLLLTFSTSLSAQSRIHIGGGLHSTEVAGPQHTLQLAYDLLSKPNDPRIANILDNVVLMLWPTHGAAAHRHQRAAAAHERIERLDYCVERSFARRS